MARFTLSVLAAMGTAGLLAACGSGGGTTSASSGSVLATRQLNGVGTVLVDQSGKTVYTPDQEAGGTIHCTGSCLGFWFPVTVASAASPLPGGLGGKVGTVHRPDGKTQVTFDGKPLYTFRLDNAPGQAQGNNFDDSFDGTSFTWRAVSTAGARPGVGATTPGGSSGYGSGSTY